MLIRPRALSLMTTRRCTAACDHCCVGSSPRATGAIPILRMHELLDEAKRIPSILRVGFTGGECFLLGDELDRLIAHAHQLELETRVITNGYWAVSPRAARERVQRARAHGLDEMMLSTGTFHQRFVPMQRVVDAARAAAEAGIPCRIAIETCDQQSFDEASLRVALADEIARQEVFLGHDPWTTDAGGRGQTPLTHTALFDEGRAVTKARCGSVLDTITVTPDQELIACCGFALEELPQLRIGSVAERTLADVLRAAPNDLMKIWLHVAGPHDIAQFIGRFIEGYDLPPSPSICDACVTLQRDPRAMAAFSAHGAEAVQHITTTFIRSSGGIEALSAF